MIAGLLLVAAMAQGQPTEIAQVPSRYSLVIDREREWRAGGEHTCVFVVSGYVCAEHDSAWYADALSPAGWYQPALLLLRWGEHNVPFVEARALPDASKRACISAAQLSRFDWHPTGPGIQPAPDGGACADLSPLHVLWAPDIPFVQMMGGRPLPPTTPVAGRRTGQRVLQLPDCTQPGYCVTFAADVTIDDAVRLSGHRVPASLTIRFNRMSPLPENDRMPVTIRGIGGRWEARWVQPQAPAGQETCVDDNLVNGIDLPSAPRARRRPGEVCFSL